MRHLILALLFTATSFADETNKEKPEPDASQTATTTKRREEPVQIHKLSSDASSIPRRQRPQIRPPDGIVHVNLA